MLQKETIMKQKQIFIVYASYDEDIVMKFKSLLEVALRNANLLDRVKITTMRDFDQSGKSHFSSNEEAIRTSDIFLAMVTSAFLVSSTIMDREIPAIIPSVEQDGRRKALFLIKTEEISPSYTNNVFLQAKNFYRSEDASKLEYFSKDIGSHTESQRQLFVEELVRKISPFLEIGTSNKITDARNLPHIDDFLKGKKRNLRVCKKDDLLLSAAYIMNIFPPLRHLIVLDSDESLYGIISVRDIYKFGFKNKVSEVENLVYLNNEAMEMPVSKLCVTREDMVFCSLSQENKIEDVLQEFIKSPTLNKPIGILPVVKKEGNFSKGEYEVISYIDILHIWKNLPGAREVEKLTADQFPRQEKIQAVTKDMPILSAVEKVKRGIRSIPVLDTDGSDGKLVGMLSDHDVMDVDQTTVKEPISIIMRKKYAKISQTMKFSTLVDLFLEHKELTSLPVINSAGKLEKMIGYTDLLKKMKEGVEANYDSE